MKPSLLKTILGAVSGLFAGAEPHLFQSSKPPAPPNDPGHPKQRRTPVRGATSSSDGRLRRHIPKTANRRAWQCVCRRAAW